MPRVLREAGPSLLVLAALASACVGHVEGDAAGGGASVETNFGGTAGTDPSSGAGGGGPVTPPAPLPSELLHRLNRLEYDNTVRELLGTALTPADAFPPDSNLNGFDNFAEGLSLSPALLDLYSGAARDLTEAALHVAPRYREHFAAKSLGKAPGFGFGTSAFSLADTTLTATLTLAQAEHVTITVQAGGTSSQAPRPILEVQVDAQAAHTFTVEALPSAPMSYTFEVDLPVGSHTVKVKSDNYVNRPGDNVANQLVVSFIDAHSEALTVPKTRANVYVCEPAREADADACYERIITGFAARAFRRPLATEESERLLTLWQSLREKEGDDEAVALVVRALLVSPNFLYRPSFTLADAAAADAQGLKPLDDYTLGSRLSYFLWSSMPDQALFDDAKAGKLQSDEGLAAAASRMLADAKASALREGFAAQWLNARPLLRVAKDPAKYPDFDEPLRQAMADEVKQFFGAFLESDLPLSRLLDPGFAFVNDRLARHYGLPLPGSEQLVRVTLPTGARGGILWQGAWLTASSEANRTSPVKRGRFVLERILCRDVPPPPPNVPPFKDPEGDVTMRERLAEHRKSPACAGCHNLLDPVGLGLEELDGIGTLRSTEAGAPIDTSGGVPGSAESATGDVPYAGAAQLTAKLRDDPRFARCLTQKLYGYALGRSVTYADTPYWEAVAAQQSSQTSLPQLLRAIVLSPAFRRQTAAEATP